MKKLLVILLLLFPVHGAGAEEKPIPEWAWKEMLHITCYSSKTGEGPVHYVIDEKTKLAMTHHGGLLSSDLRIEGDVLSFDVRKEYLKELSETSEYKSLSETIIINRYSGTLIVKTKFVYDGKTYDETLKFDCKESKKKF